MCNLGKWPQESDSKYLHCLQPRFTAWQGHFTVLGFWRCWCSCATGIELGSKDMAETEGDWDPVHVLIHAAEAGLHTATSSLLTAAQFLLSEK